MIELNILNTPSILHSKLAYFFLIKATIRCLAARALREIAASHPDTYKRDLQAFILPLLETEADSQKEVNFVYSSFLFCHQLKDRPILKDR